MKEQESKSRIDRIVEDAGTHLASRNTRRGFLGKVAGIAGATVFGGAVILGENKRAEAIQAGCHGTADAQVCYSYWRVREPLGASLYKGPHSQSPFVYGTASNLPYYNQPVRLEYGALFAAQSERSTTGAACHPNVQRQLVQGTDGIVWMWGYSAATKKSGWCPYYSSSYTWLEADWYDPNNFSCGPANVDFDCRDNGLSDAQKRIHCPNYNGCGGQGPGDVTDSGAYWNIRDAGSNLANSDQQFYLRYAPNSVPIGWVCPNDKIKRLSYKSGWSCIYCYCTAWMPYGCRGWIDSAALGSPGSYNSCGGSPVSTCPQGGSYYP